MVLKELMKNGKKSKILLLFCGGTISMAKNPETGVLDIAGGTEKMINVDPRLKEVVDIEIEFIDNVDSTNITIEHWNKMVKIIQEKYDEYDGFVITHGTDTMGFTSSALAFALQGIGKPVVLTGSQIPAEQIGSDAIRNFINAIRVATMNLSGVFVVFGSKIIIGSRAKKISESDLDAFKTYNDEDLGIIGININLSEKSVPRHNRMLFSQPGFDENIMVVTLEPGINGKYVEKLIDSGVKGLIIRAYGAGNIPYNLHPQLEKAKSKKIPIVVTTQCAHGKTQLNLYDVGYSALKLGVIPANDMCIEAATTKLMWLLDKKVPYEKMPEKFKENMAGEIKTY